MNKFRDLTDNENQSESNALPYVPGAATIKAYSIVVNAFLRPLTLITEPNRNKAITGSVLNDSSFSDKTISPAPLIYAEKQEGTVPEESQEIPAVSKAQGMVHHLKHTHTKNSLS